MQLTAARLEHAVRQAVTDTAIKDRAAEIGRRIGKEDGVCQAVSLFQRHMEAIAAPPTATILPSRAA